MNMIATLYNICCYLEMLLTTQKIEFLITLTLFLSYQSANSHSETSSYVSDDFFALLDEEESISENSPSIPFLDISVGRFPVQTIEEARIVVDKVFNYHEELAMGAWRLNVCFVGDDNDVSETVHTAQAEDLADELTESYPLYNIDKIYLDAYQQESTLEDSDVS